MPSRRCESLVVEKDTVIVIEGFPRSANTFACNAFRLSQEKDVKIAHHLHAPAQIIGAAKMNIPAVVQIRNPDDAVLSLVVRSPFISIRIALREYTLFYETILSYRDHFIVAKFEDVIRDFGSVIREINDRFGTDFKEFIHNEENVAKSYKMPSQDRRMRKEQLREAYNDEKLANLRQRADRVYRAIISK
jgi:hypothetical protein